MKAIARASSFSLPPEPVPLLIPYGALCAYGLVTASQTAHPAFQCPSKNSALGSVKSATGHVRLRTGDPQAVEVSVAQRQMQPDRSAFAFQWDNQAG